MAHASQTRAALWLLIAFAPSACATLDTPAPPPAAEPVRPILPKPAPPPAKLTAEAVKGLSPRQVLAVFGAPSLTRSEGAMSVLQFTGGSCIVDMVFDGSRAVIYLEARAKSGIPIDVQPCLDRFRQTLPVPSADDS